MTFETPVTLDRIAKCQLFIRKQTEILPQKIATILALRLTKRFLQIKLYNKSIKSGQIYFRIKVSCKDASNIVIFCQNIKSKIFDVDPAGIQFPAGGERESSHYGQSEIRANYGANQHHLQAARPKASAGEPATICKKRGRK